jgi:oxygen-independent coproporphyrinogen-3 oxidase
MVGVGCGARSYTRGLHYSREYAVGAQGIRSILGDYLARPADAFAVADYGFRLNPDEQRRRYLLQSLLQADGLDQAAYRRRFGAEVLTDFPELMELADRMLALRGAERLQLSASGVERSDAIGPWLYSSRVRELMGAYESR